MPVAVAGLPYTLMATLFSVALTCPDIVRAHFTFPAATATSSLDFSSGTLTFDTTHGYWHHTSGVHGTGVLEQKDDGGIQYQTSTFTFDSINLASGLTVKLQGENALILKTRNHGNITIGTNLNANGGDSEVTPSGYSDSLSSGLGRLGGYDGGDKNSTANGNGLGTGGGKYLGGGVTNNFVGGGGGYGSSGQYYANDTAFGKTYGSTALTHLHGGSGGGGTTATGGGAGGGAISLEADGNGILTIQSGATISANGGGIASTLANAGGGGSGGSIRLAGKSITNNGSIQAKGGTPPPRPPPMTEESAEAVGWPSITRSTWLKERSISAVVPISVLRVKIPHPVSVRHLPQASLIPTITTVNTPPCVMMIWYFGIPWMKPLDPLQ